LQVLLFGFLLFFSHGLVFLFASAVGASFLLARFQKRPNGKLQHWLLISVPYLGLALLCITYVIVSKSTEFPNIIDDKSIDYGTYWVRPIQFILYSLGRVEDYLFFPIALFLLSYPFLLGSRLRHQMDDSFIPFLVLMLVWAACPSKGMAIAFLYDRFAIFNLVFYALIFQPKQKSILELSFIHRMREVAAIVLVIISCWAFLAVQSVRFVQFAKESKDFDKILAAAEPEHLALSLVFDAYSPASNSRVAYRHYPAWYQAEAGGFVEFNFAAFLPQIVRYRADKLSEVFTTEPKPIEFRWKEDNADRFYYIFVRHIDGLPSDIFAGAGCRIIKLAESGPWALYRGCAN
jgi:hypothetical protein